MYLPNGNNLTKELHYTNYCYSYWYRLYFKIVPHNVYANFTYYDINEYIAMNFEIILKYNKNI